MDCDVARRYVRATKGFLFSMLMLFVSRPSEYEMVSDMTMTEAAKHLGRMALPYLPTGLLREWKGI